MTASRGPVPNAICAGFARRTASLVRVEIADVRATARLRDAAAEAGTVFHLAVAGRRNHQPRRSGRGFRDQCRRARSSCSKCCAQRGGRERRLIFTSTNKVYGAIDDIDLVERGSRYVPAGALAGTGVAETRPLQFHSPYGCSKGAADQYVLDYARSYGLANGRAAHELHLWAASARHRGPGLGRPFPDPGDAGKADHDLRRRQAGARPAFRRRSRPRADCSPSDTCPKSPVRPSISAAGRTTRSACWN